MRGRETIQITTPGDQDRYGDSGTAGEPVEVPGCVIWPRTSTEDSSLGERIIAGLNVYVPPGSPAVPTVLDRVNARGEDYEVDGVPGRYVGTSGMEKGTIVVLKKAGTVVEEETP